MFELSEEETLMTSSDNSVKLTTHRFIYESEKGRQQIMLEDFESFRLKRSSIGSYGILLLLFLLFIFILTFSKIENYYQNPELFKRSDIGFFDFFLKDTGYIVMLFVLAILHFFYLISRRNTITVIGKYNSIEFRVKNFKAASVQKMLNMLVKESNKRKST